MVFQRFSHERPVTTTTVNGRTRAVHQRQNWSIAIATILLERQSDAKLIAGVTNYRNTQGCQFLRTVSRGVQQEFGRSFELCRAVL